ncbi:MAG: cellulase family glycosylhydrolase, partial [Fimbriimonadales bacterium]
MWALLAAMALSDYRARFPLPDDVVPNGWGVNIHFTRPAPGEVEMIREAGFRWVRMDLFWHHIEKERGVYDFSDYDVLVESLEKNGIRPLFILDYGNDLYQKGSPSTPEARAAFCRFVEAAVKRYRGKGVLWEMWNEPNIFFWQPTPNVEHYTALALEVGETIRRVAPEEWYVGPATSGFDWSFLEACFRKGLLRYWDAVTVHPYRGVQPETVLPDWFRLRELIDRYAPAGKRIPMFSGEWGYSELYSGLNLELQSRWAPRQYLVNLAGGAPLSIWYDWKNDGTDPKEIEHHFGTVYHDLRRKPTYDNIQATARALDGARFNKRLAQDDPDRWVLLFERGGGALVAEWSAKTGSDTLPAIRKADLPSAVLRWPRLPLGTRAASAEELASLLAWPGAPATARLRVEALPPGAKRPAFSAASKPDRASLAQAISRARGFRPPGSDPYRIRVGLVLP